MVGGGASNLRGFNFGPGFRELELRLVPRSCWTVIGIVLKSSTTMVSLSSFHASEGAIDET